ncbi:MAG: hypothetical protein ACOYYS_02895 [Chloroflexota bacterium]
MQRALHQQNLIKLVLDIGKSPALIAGIITVYWLTGQLTAFIRQRKKAAPTDMPISPV